MDTKVFEILKTMGTKMSTIKKREKKIASALPKYFKFQTTEICFNEHSRIRLATIYIYIHPHISTSCFKSMIFFSVDPCFDFTLYAMQVCFHIYPYLSST